jgi:vacuolar-type H+-ATPase subunit H
MDDLEALKTIKEKELAIEKEIREFKMEQEQKYNDLKKEVELEIKNIEKREIEDYNNHINSVRAEISKKVEAIINEAKSRAESKSIAISDSDLKNLVAKLLNEYLEVV